MKKRAPKCPMCGYEFPRTPEGKPRGLPRWPEHQEEKLLDLWEKGLSYAAIAKELGINKGAVSGKAHRLGLNYCSR